MTNYFDQFDVAVDPGRAPVGNFFDQFDTPAEPRSLLKEVPIQTYAGATIDLPRMFGQALQWMSDPDRPTYQAGREIQDWAEQREKEELDLAPQVEGRGLLGRALSTGARALAPSAAIMLPAAAGAMAAPIVGGTALIGSAAGAGVGAFGLFGTAQAQDTYEKLRKAGVDDEDAREAGWINLMIEGGGETVGTIAGLKLFGLAGKAITKGMSPAAGAIAGATGTAVLEPFLKQLPKTLATEMGTEFGQGYGEAWVEQRYGAPQEPGQSPLTQGVHGAEAALGMTLLLAPFGLSGFAARAKQNERRANALEDPTTPVLERLAASAVVFNEINAVDKDAAKAWSQNSTLAIMTGSPIILDETTAQPAASPAVIPGIDQPGTPGPIIPSIAASAADEETKTAAGIEAINAGQDIDAITKAAADAASQPIGPPIDGIIGSIFMSKVGQAAQDAKDAAEVEQKAIDEAQPTPATSPTAVGIAMQKAQQVAQERTQRDEDRRIVKEASDKAKAVQQAEKERLEAVKPLPADLPILQRIIKREAVSDAEAQPLLAKGFIEKRKDDTYKIIGKGIKARSFLLRQNPEARGGAPVEENQPSLSPRGQVTPEVVSGQVPVLPETAATPSAPAQAAAPAVIKPVAISKVQPEAKAPVAPPVAVPAGLEVERFQGQHKKGMSERVAATQQKRLAAKKPKLTWTVEKSTVPEFPDRFDVVGRKPASPAQAEAGQAIEDAKPAPDVPPHAVENLETMEVPLAGLTLSRDVPQFKAAASAEGIIVPLGGKFDRTGVGPIQVWQRLDGAMEVISGRHRFDLAKRSGETTIPAQVHREADGFDVRQAATLDAKLNIREEQGSVADYANYFKNAGISKETADAEGLLARAKGRAGFSIARDASPDLLAAHSANLLSDEAALSISQAAPGDAALQALGIKTVNDGKAISFATNLMRAASLMSVEREAAGEQGDIFGFDDSAMREAADMAKKASGIQRGIAEQIAAVSGASKRPEIAAKMGVDVKNPKAVQAKIAELKIEKGKWDNWPTHPELVAQLREGNGKVEQGRARYNPNQAGMFDQPAAAPAVMPERPSGDTDATLARFRPKQMTIFAHPYVGRTGAKLTGYEWKWRAEEIVDRRGEDKTIRISDWEEAITNPETNRDIVHQFQIERTDGTMDLVSAETAARLLGVSQSTARASAKRLLEQEIEAQRQRGALERYLQKLDGKEWFKTPAEAVSALPGALSRIWSKYRRWGEHIGKDDSYNYTQTKVDFTKGPKGYVALEAATDEQRGWKAIQLTPTQIWDKNGLGLTAETRPDLALTPISTTQQQREAEAIAKTKAESEAAAKAKEEAERQKKIEAEIKARNEIGATSFELTAPAAGGKKAMKAANDKEALDQLAGQGRLLQESPVYQAVTALQGAVNDLAKAIAPGVENATQEPLSVEERKNRNKGEASPQRDLFAETEVSRKENPQPTILVEPVKRGTLHIGFDRIDTTEKAAHAFAALRKGPREYFQILLTDKNDKPLAVFNLFAGTVGQTSVYPREVLTAAYATPGAAKIWFAHNHPSGIAKPSTADEVLTRQIGEGLGPDLGIQFQGHVIIAGNKAVFFDNERQHQIEIPPASRKYAVPIMERTIKRQSFAKKVTLDSPDAARAYIKDNNLSESGLILTNYQNDVLAFWPMKREDMAKLRTGDPSTGFAALARMVSKLNPASAMVFDPSSHFESDVHRAAANLKTALNLMDVKLLDALSKDRSGALVSAASNGSIVASPTFFSQKDGAAAGQTVSQVEDQMAKAIEKLTIPVVIHDNVEAARAATGVDIPGTARGMYHDGKVHLFAENLSSPLDAEFAFWHEVLHAGLSNLYGTGSREYEAALTKIAVLNRNIRQNAAMWRGKYGKEATKRALDYGMTEAQAKRYVTLQSFDEAIADLSGANAKISGLKQFLAAVQKFLRSIGLTNLADAMEGKTDAEALALIRAARRAVMKQGAHIGMPETAPAFSYFSKAGVTDIADARTRREAALDRADRKHERENDIAIADIFDRRPTQYKVGAKVVYGGRMVELIEQDGRHSFIGKDLQTGAYVYGIYDHQLSAPGLTPQFSRGAVAPVNFDVLLPERQAVIQQRIAIEHPQFAEYTREERADVAEEISRDEVKQGGRAFYFDRPVKSNPDIRYSRAARADQTETPESPTNPDIRFSQPVWTESLPQAQKDALVKAGVITPDLTIKDRVRELTADFGKKFTQGVFDQFSPIKELDYNAYMLARMSRGSDGGLEAMMMYGRPYMDGGALNVGMEGGGLLNVFQDLQGEHDRFLAWIAGNRAQVLKAEGRENLFTDDDISALKDLNQGNMPNGVFRRALYAKTHQRFNAYMNAILDIAQDTGLIDAESRDVWAKDFYVPFYRTMEDGAGGPTIKSGLVNQYAFKKLKGGQEGLRDLMANTLMNWSHLLSASLKNQAARASLKAAEGVGAARAIHGQEKGAVSAMVDGRKVWYEVDDPFILDAITAMEWSGFKGPAMVALGKFKRALTFGVTVSPTFKIRNLLRDTVASIAQGDLSYNAAKNMAQGWRATAHSSQTRASMMAGGGLMRFGTLLEGNTAEHTKRLINSGVDANSILDKPHKVVAMLQKMWDAYQETGDRGEQMNRAALYEQLRERGLSHLEASFQARDLLDFSMQGKWAAVRFLTQVVPFMNARLQGMYKLGRAAKNDPKRMAYVIGALSLASMALLLWSADDDDWKKREDWDRDQYWWFKIGDQAFRIPKPFEVGAIASVAERSLEYLISSERDPGRRFMKSMGNMISNNLSMNPIPQLVKPLIDIYANKDSFTGRQIETEGMQNLSKGERIGRGTSIPAQILGKLDPTDTFSPVQVDFMARAYFGWLGTAALTTLDYGLRPFSGLPGKPEAKMRDFPVIGNFTEGLPANQSRYVTLFYDEAKIIHEAYADWRQAIKMGDTEKAGKLLKDKGELIRKQKLTARIQKVLGVLNQRERKIEIDKTISPQEKRIRVDAISAQKDRIAKQITQRAMQ